MAGESILIADDHPLFRQALSLAASRVCPNARIIEAGTLDTASRAAEANADIALILLDLNMPGATGYSGVALLHAERPGVPILVVSSAEASSAAAEARRFGAVGFVSKESDLGTIEKAIAGAIAGETIEPPASGELDDVAARVAALTPTQLRVLLGVLDGRLNKQIAFDLGITEATVKAHMTVILRKLDVGNRTQAALAARALGIGIKH